MARQEEEREDLMREAVALVDRCEIQVQFLAETVVVGFRRDGSASFFFGQNEVYQFNSRDQIRRGYDGEALIKSVDGQLVRMIRRREGDRVHLVSRPFTTSETERYLSQVAGRLNELGDCLQNGEFSSLQVSTNPSEDLVSRIVVWIANRNSIEIAKSPRVGSR